MSSKGRNGPSSLTGTKSGGKENFPATGGKKETKQSIRRQVIKSSRASVQKGNEGNQTCK